MRGMNDPPSPIPKGLTCGDCAFGFSCLTAGYIQNVKTRKCALKPKNFTPKPKKARTKR